MVYLLLQQSDVVPQVLYLRAYDGHGASDLLQQEKCTGLQCRVENGASSHGWWRTTACAPSSARAPADVAASTSFCCWNFVFAT